MRQEIKFAIAMIAVGASVVTWANLNFPSKERVEKLETRTENLLTKDDMKEFKKDIKEWIELYVKKQ